MHNTCSGIEAPRKRNLHQLEPWIASLALATPTLPSHQPYKIWICSNFASQKGSRVQKVNKRVQLSLISDKPKKPQQIMLQSQYTVEFGKTRYTKNRKNILSVTRWLTHSPTTIIPIAKCLLRNRSYKEEIATGACTSKPCITYNNLPSHTNPTSTPVIWTRKSQSRSAPNL